MLTPKRLLLIAFLAFGMTAQAEEPADRQTEAEEIPEIVVIADKIEDRTVPLIASQEAERRVHGAVLEDLSERIVTMDKSLEWSVAAPQITR